MRRFDRSFVADAAAVLLGLAAAWFALDAAFSDLEPERRGGAEAPQVGRVAQQYGAARRKAESTLVWEPLAPGDALRNRDAVFVPENSLAVVAFGDGSTLQVGASSLVVLERSLSPASPEPAEVQLVRGTVTGEAAGTPLRVSAGGASLELGGGSRAALSVSRERMRVEGLAGRTTLQSGGTRLDLGADASARVEGSGRAPTTVRRTIALVAPRRAEPIYFAAELPAVRLSWTSVGADVPHQVEVASDPLFEEVVRAESVVGESLDFVAPGEGVYYWRVSAGPARSEERTLVLVHDVPPVPLQPRSGSIVYAPEGAAVAFFWSRAPNASQYRLEVATDAEFAHPVVDVRVDRTEHWYRGRLSEGVYYWRVRSAGAGRSAAPPSAPERFRLARQPLPRAPRLYDPQLDFGSPARAPETPRGTWLWRLVGGVAHAAEGRGKAGLLLRWEAVPGVRRYVLEIALDREFRQVQLRRDVGENRFRWEELPGRNFYWRVKSVDHGGREGEFSEPRLVEAIRSQPDPIAPEDGAVAAPGNPEIRLSWTAVRTSAHYLVQLSPDPTFALDAQEHRVDGATHLKWPARPGLWHWHVRSVDAAGDSSPWGATFRLEVPEPAPEPVAAPETTAPRRHAEVALATEGIRLEWSKRSGARYQVQLSRVPDFGSDVLSFDSDNASLRAPVELPGMWHWRVRAAGADGRWSPWGRASTFLAVLAPPVLEQPAPGAELPVQEPPLSVQLQWRASPRATGHLVELVAESAGGDARTLTTEKAQLDVELEPGAWTWQVRAVAADGTVSEPSEARRLLVLRPPPPAAPEPTTEGAPPLVCARTAAEVAWAPAPRAARYEVELVREGEEPAVRSVEDTRLQLPGLASGTWSWRARSVDAEGAAGPWGRTVSFVCERPPPAARARVRTSPEPVPVDGSAEATIEVTLEDAQGAPAEEARLVATASSGALSEPQRTGPGRWTLRWKPQAHDGSGAAGLRLRDEEGGFSTTHTIALRPPPWRFQPRFFTGTRLGLAHNVGDLWAPRLGGELGFHFKAGDWSLAASTVVGYGWSGREVAERDGALAADATLHAVPVELRALALWKAKWASPYAGLALTADVVRATARVPGQPEVAAGGVLFGGGVVAGAERRVGEFAVFFEASLGGASRLTGLFDIDARGATLSAGARYELP